MMHIHLHSPAAFQMWTRRLPLSALREMKPDDLPKPYRDALLAELMFRGPRHFMHSGNPD